MSARLCFAVCHGFQAEVAAAIAAEGWDDVDCIGFPVRCGRPPLDAAALRATAPAGCTQLVVLGAACSVALRETVTPAAGVGGADARPGGLPEPLPVPVPVPVRVRPLAQCFHLVAGPTAVAEALAGGAYLLTPAWLADWPQRMAELGFASPAPATPGAPGASAAAFFADFAQELLLLDTGCHPEARAQLPALGAALQRPVRRLAVGLDTTRALLAQEVLQWRLQNADAAARAQRQEAARERADHAAALDVLGWLAQEQDEVAAIAAIEELLRMLFAPRELHHLRVENGVDLPEPGLPPAVQAALGALDQAYAWAPGGDGFLLRIGNADAVVGKLAVLGLAYPAQRERYLNMALALTGACSLVIQNARIRAQLQRAEKLASLSIVVAGVAHEINTPLGVNLMAVTTLQDHTRQLARSFEERRMTQNDLAAYLRRAEESSALVRGNLERIGTLVERFREAVVGEAPAPAGALNLRHCVDEVLCSLGDRLPQAGVQVRVECDPALTIGGHAGDWASIFTNLIVNSLHHGFQGRGHGGIDIHIEARGPQLCVDYRDDGAGMNAATRAHVFDPFFTTALQQGMGLGMHLVWNLVTQRFGGRIRCDSEPGQGAHFHIEVPR